MTKQKPVLARGTRDFGPSEMARRKFIFKTIERVFQKFGFQPLETPSIEQLSVLMGKYGQEGDQLLFKILNSGDFLKNVEASDLNNAPSQVLHKLSEKGLRYDLTVPFARYVAMNRHDLVFPFKRYQIQPVWRADRPQKGRYREFFQCDADVVGTESLVCESEIIQMMAEVFELLGITGVSIKLNHRKILAALASLAGKMDKFSEFCVAIDKLDKIGTEKVIAELEETGFDQARLKLVFNLLGTSTENLVERLQQAFADLDEESSVTGSSGLSDIKEILEITSKSGTDMDSIRFDPSLARGLSYYTGAIFEVTVDDGSMGSLSGGGRYDDLTGVFGLPDVPGVGFSLGVDRIYDLMGSRNLFPELNFAVTEVLICPMDDQCFDYALPLVTRLRANDINTEIYPSPAKMKKQMAYADRKKIPFVIVIGSNERETGTLVLKDMNTGQQQESKIEEIISTLKRG